MLPVVVYSSKPADFYGKDQREGLSLPEYQAMSSLRDVAHDGWLCTFTVHITAVGNSFSPQWWAAPGEGNRYGTEKAAGTARPSRTKRHMPGHSPLASKLGRSVGPAL